jgi:hypothetical protein
MLFGKGVPIKDQVASQAGISKQYAGLVIRRIPKCFDTRYSYELSTGEELFNGEGMTWEVGMPVRVQHFEGKDDGDTFELVDLRLKFTSEEILEETVREMFEIKEPFELACAYSYSTDLGTAAAKALSPVACTPLATCTPKNNMKEGSIMSKFNFLKDFGPITDGSVALTMDGHIAVKSSADEYVRYDPKTKTLLNQMSFVVKAAEGMIYLLPVTSVAVGDVIKHKESYVQIIAIDKDQTLKYVALKTGTHGNAVREVNIFGFSFYYKVVSLFDQGENATLGGINPMMFMLLADSGADKYGKGSAKDKLLPLMLMSGAMGQQPKIDADGKPVLDKDGKLTYDAAAPAMNPMMMMAMMGDGGLDMKNLMLMQMLGGQGGGMFGTAGSQMNPMLMLALMGGDKGPF